MPLDASVWSGRRALVTGVTGFVGAELAAWLLARGAIVRGLDRDWDRADGVRAERIAMLTGHPSFEPAAVELSERGAVASALRGCEGAVVFHLAARPGVRHPILAETYADNVTATEVLLSLLVGTRPAHVIFASSSSVYGRSAPLPFREDGPVGGHASAYARSKVIGEHLIDRFARATGIATTTARLFNVYGARARPDLAASIFVRRLRAGEAIELTANGAIERDMAHVDDVCAALAALSTRPIDDATRALTINVGTGRRVSMRELVGLLAARLDRDARVDLRAPDPASPDMPATEADITRLRALVPWACATSLQDGLARMLAPLTPGAR